MNNEAVAIRTENLLKSFGDYRAIDNLDLDIKRGEIYGLVGPDGSGKTTLMRLLTAIMEPDSGQAWVAGHSVVTESERVKEKIGYMSQRFGLYEDLTVIENIIFYADLYDVPRKERPERIERLLGFSNLTPFKARLAGKLSGGMKQKLGLACALIHTPEILFLDEPTNGVDPVSRRDFWKILYDLLKEGITIFVSTAYLDEAERCTRVGLIHKGKLLAEDDPAAMKKSFGYPMIALWADDPRRAIEVLKMVPGIKNISIYGDRLHIALESPELMETIVFELQAAGIVMKSYRNIIPTLEDIFITKVAGDE
ncbi:MAG TPA: ABC transporter ATP-binding protein [Nitrospirae bacterium]|nr:putative ABC transporter ATP-binding protein YbhF [bacterium BMS3Abin06]HDH12543.1 ABC transporter ATP-binding protein [Nitrospirota bacterium]HDZ00702.1 ABC transporter ATP-binding protein [Nitrospirota bacterium]